MPTSGTESTTDDVLYPDEQPGRGFTVQEQALKDADVLFWDAGDDDDAEDMPEDAQYGWFLPTYKLGTDAEIWVAAPRQLREALTDADDPSTFRVVEVEEGAEEHDPYEYDVEVPYET